MIARCFLFFLVCGPSLLWGQSKNGFSPKISPSLIEQIDGNSTSHIHGMYLLMEDRVAISDQDEQLSRIPFANRAHSVISQLKTKAQSSQHEVLAILNEMEGVESIRPMWITNLIFLKAAPAAISQISQLPQVSWVGWDAPVQTDAYTDEFIIEPSSIPGGSEPGLGAIGAPAMWALGYTGYGRSVLSIDTGVDPAHPAISSNFRGNYVATSHAWFDYNNGTTAPNYCGDHGTHTVGTMVGLERATSDTIGVAFEGMWMGANSICDGLSSDNIAAFQWALDPDGDPTTTSDMPDVINNSWRTVDVADECMNEAYIDVFNALEAAGIAVVFSAGNEGPSASSISAPKNINTGLVNTFSVGALRGTIANTPVTSYSSRGPSLCGGTGSLEIKPEVSAPGDKVRSCILNGNYGRKSGTSMAAPHVSGAILLLKEAFPTLTGTELKLALYQTCIDLGDPGEDNDYGMGRIDVFQAYTYLVNQGNVPVVPTNSDDAAIEDIQEISSLVCDNVVAPAILIGNKGDNPLTTAQIQYQYQPGPSGSINWVGNLSPGESELVQLPAEVIPHGNQSLKIEIVEPNGVTTDYHYLDNTAQVSFFVTRERPATTSNDTICAQGQGLLSASIFIPGEIVWFDQAAGGVVLHKGSPFITPSLSNDKTYFAGIQSTRNTGMPNNLMGKGEYALEPGGFLQFDCENSFILKSVDVYSQADGYRTIELQDATGAVLTSKTQFLNIGPATIDLYFTINPGMNQRLILLQKGSLFRQLSGASYPYRVPGVLSITGSSSKNNEYDFFYNWEIEYELACERTPSHVSIGEGTMNTAFNASNHSLNLPGNGTVSFTDQTSGAVTWLWDFGDGTTSNEQHPTHIYSQTGVFQVNLSAAGVSGCSDVSSDTIYVNGINTSIENSLLARESISLFPNPSSGSVTISINLDKTSDIQTLMIDINGRVILEKEYLQITKHSAVLDLDSLADGLYYFQFRSANETYVLKWAKQ